jgi:hypothetical protein
MGYHRFKSVDGEFEYGSFEVFHKTAEEIGNEWDSSRIGSDGPQSGWYWWACFPGCLPDGDPTGPFETEQAAIDDAIEEG